MEHLIKQLQPKEGVTLLAYLLEKGVYNISIRLVKKTGRYWINYDIPNGGYTNHRTEELPEGNWQLLGTPEQIDELTWRGLVKYVGMPWCAYKDYRTDKNWFNTATESGLSFLEANEVYSKNPIPVPQFNGDYDKDWVYAYEKAEANTGTWVILQLV